MIELRPGARQTCFECIHYEERISTRGASGFCLEWQDEIVSEIASAKDCLAFEPGREE